MNLFTGFFMPQISLLLKTETQVLKDLLSKPFRQVSLLVLCIRHCQSQVLGRK